MQIPKHIIVKNSSGDVTAYLSPSTDGLKDCYIDTRLNGESTLEFLLPANSEKISELTPESTIWAGGRVYSLLVDDAIDLVRDEQNRLWAKFMAVERWKTELEISFIEPSLSNDPTTPVPADLAVIIVSGGADLSGGRFPVGSAGHALYAVLNGTGWSVGTVDVLGTYDLEMEKTSRLELVKAIQEKWGGYLVWDSENKIVHLRSGDTWQNYNGFQIRYKKNLKHITRTQSNRIITKLYPFGHDDLDIASVNSGVKYITNFSYTSREYIGIYRNQDIYNAQELKEKATAELEFLCRPRYKYTVKIVDLRTLPEYSHENFALGDMVDIIDPEVAPESPRPRLIRHKYNFFRPWECELEIGDPEERLVELLKASFDTVKFIDGKFNGNGKSSGFSIEDMTITDGKIVNLNAAKITAGYLSADRIQAGSIGADKIKTNELIVGDNIAMGPNARISWSQVTNQPYIPSTSDISNIATTITANYVATPNLITNIARVANYLSIGNSADTTSKSIIFYEGDVTRDATIEASMFGGHSNLEIAAASIIMRAWDSIQLDGTVIFSGSVLGLNFAPVNHNHGNSYIKSYTGQDLSIVATDAGLVVRLNGSVLGSLLFD